jgi:hypothetical protein
MVFTLRRSKRVACGRCGASHPAIYGGQGCLICGSTIAAVTRHRPRAGAGVTERHSSERTEEQYRAQLAALQSERDELRALQAAGSRPDPFSSSDYEHYVHLAAKGMAERDTYPMPKSVTTAEAFYEVMAAAALDATGLWHHAAPVPTGASGRRGQPRRQVPGARAAVPKASRARHRSTRRRWLKRPFSRSPGRRSAVRIVIR